MPTLILVNMELHALQGIPLNPWKCIRAWKNCVQDVADGIKWFLE
jgi:hypothetical protein